MSIIKVWEDYEARDGDETKDGRTYTRVFNVLTSNHQDGCGAVRNAVNIARGDIYETDTESDSGAYCLKKQARVSAEDAKQWTVTVSYGPPPNGQSQESQNPIDQPVEVSWSFAQFERPVDVTVKGKPIVNTAGDQFQDQQVRDDSRPVLTVTRNEASFNAALAYSYRDTVNSDEFFGAAPGECKCSNISATRQYDASFGYYWRVTYEFMFSADNFKLKILSAGLREKGEDGKLKNILVQSKEVTEPVLLTKTGKQAKPGDPGYVQEFEIYNSTSFAAFNLE